jgi:tetratricopeptide (TPR) repeat protein
MAKLGYGSDEAGKVAAKTVELCRNIGDENALATALYQAWLFNYARANLDEAFRIACELRDRMREADDQTARVIAPMVMGLTLFARGEIGTALEEFETAIRTDLAGEGVPVAYRYGMDAGAAALGYGAWCCAMLGESATARQGRQRLLNRLEKTQHVFTLGRRLN